MGKEKKTLIKNLSSLFVIQIANYIFPLISIPYVVRVIGPANYGLVSYAAAIVLYFVMFINFGFDYTATRKIAQNRDNKTLIDETFNLVLGSKLLLSLICVLLFALAMLFIPVFKQEPKLMIFSFIITFAWVITPNWLYQGKQELHRTALFNFFSKAVFTGLIFLLITKKEDYIYQPLALSVAQLAVGVFSFAYAVKRYHIKLKLPSFKAITTILFNERLVFFSTVVISLYTTTNTVILGALSNNLEVAYFAGAKNLIIIAHTVVSIPIAQSFFPFIGGAFGKSKENGIATVQKVFPVITSFTLLCGLGMMLIGPIVITLFYGKEFENSIPIFRLLSLVPFIISISNLYGIQVMMNLKMDRIFFRITLGGAIFSILLNSVMVILYGAWGAAITWLLTEIIIALSTAIYLRTQGIRLFTIKSYHPANFTAIIKSLFNKK